MVGREYDVGMIGIGVMGANLVLNIADHGFSVVVYDATAEKTREFIQKEAGNRKIKAAGTLRELVGLLRRPRAIILLVPAGTPVDAVIGDLIPCLEQGPRDLRQLLDDRFRRRRRVELAGRVRTPLHRLQRAGRGLRQADPRHRQAGRHEPAGGLSEGGRGQGKTSFAAAAALAAIAGAAAGATAMMAKNLGKTAQPAEGPAQKDQ